MINARRNFGKGFNCYKCGERNDYVHEFGEQLYLCIAHKSCWEQATIIERLEMCQRKCDYHATPEWWEMIAPLIWSDAPLDGMECLWSYCHKHS